MTADVKYKRGIPGLDTAGKCFVCVFVWFVVVVVFFFFFFLFFFGGGS